MNRIYFRWAPTTIYLAIAVGFCLDHRATMEPLASTYGSAAQAFADTKAGLQRGEALSTEGQIVWPASA